MNEYNSEYIEESRVIIVTINKVDICKYINTIKVSILNNITSYLYYKN